MNVDPEYSDTLQKLLVCGLPNRTRLEKGGQLFTSYLAGTRAVRLYNVKETSRSQLYSTAFSDVCCRYPLLLTHCQGWDELRCT